jgi:hypothetical protein
MLLYLHKNGWMAGNLVQNWVKKVQEIGHEALSNLSRMLVLYGTWQEKLNHSVFPLINHKMIT